MAKQLVGPVERHVDKVILGIAGLALIVVVAKFLVTSPNKLEIRNETVTPRTIDQRVREFAQSVRQTIRSATPPDHELDVLATEFASTADSFRADGEFAWPAVAALLPKVPLVGPPVVIEGDIRLISAPSPGKPVVVFGRSTLYLPPVDGVDEDEESLYSSVANWATVSAVVDVDQLRTLQRNHYLPDREEVTFARVDAQRQEKGADGSWPEAWNDVAAFHPDLDRSLPVPPVITLLTQEDRITVDHPVMLRIEGYFSELKRPDTQLNLIRPMPPEMVTETYWTLPVIPGSSRMAVLRMDDQYLYPDEKPAEVPDDRYPDAVEEEEDFDSADESESIQDANRRLFKEADALLKQGKRDNSIELVIQAQNKWLRIIAPSNSIAGQRSPPADVARATKLRSDAEQVKRDIRRRIRQPGPRRPRGPDAPQAIIRPVLPTQQVWVHDAAEGSLQSGKTYRYRVRTWIYNRMAGLPNLLADPEDATIPMLATGWSEPSEPILMPADRRYFLTSANKNRNEVGFEFFQWFEGVWTKPRGTQKFGVGDTMSFVARAPLPSREDPEEVDNAELRFSADATLLDIEFDRPTPQRTRTRRKGFLFEDKPDTTVAFVDSKGHVFERRLTTDKSHPGRGIARDQVYTPPRKMSAGPIKPSGPQSGLGSRGSSPRGPRGSRKKGTGGGP